MEAGLADRRGKVMERLEWCVANYYRKAHCMATKEWNARAECLKVREV